jgi:hypothetical protein
VKLPPHKQESQNTTLSLLLVIDQQAFFEYNSLVEDYQIRPGCLHGNVYTAYSVSIGSLSLYVTINLCSLLSIDYFQE